MAGGIFPGYPFVLNPKCVVFSSLIIWLFFYNPPVMTIYWKLLISLILFVIAYVAMAWYDYKFECQALALKRGTSKYGITQQFKPPTHKENQRDPSKDTPDETALEKNIINVYHLLFITPSLLYIGLEQQNASVNASMFLIVNLIFAMIYHIPRFMRNYNYISLAHIFAGLGGIYYLVKTNRPKVFYTSLIIFSVYVGLKHGFQLMELFH